MYQKSPIEAATKKTPTLKLRPGVFSDPANLMAKNHNDDVKRKPKATQHLSEYVPKRDKTTASSFLNQYRGVNHINTEEDPFSTLCDPTTETFHEDHNVNGEYIDPKPLEERSNRLSKKLSLAEKVIYSCSEKAQDKPEENHLILRRQASANSLHKRTSLKGFGLSYDNRVGYDVENRENNPMLKNSHMSMGSRPKTHTNLKNQEVAVSKGLNAARARSVGKFSTVENNNFKTPETSIIMPMEEKDEHERLESLLEQNTELWKNIKRLNGELNNEKAKNSMLEHELNSLSEGITEERGKYQEEFIKISHEIKKFQSIQTAYIKEKKMSQALEQQLSVQEKVIEELSSFINECLQMLINQLEFIILKGDVSFEKQLKNQEFSAEDLFRFCYDLKKPIIQKLELAEKHNFKFEWKTHDYDQLIKYSKDLEKLRRTQNFKIQLPKTNGGTEESTQRSSNMVPSSQSNRSTNVNPLLQQFNSNHYGANIRNNIHPHSSHRQYQSNDYSILSQNTELNKNISLNISSENHSRAEKYIPLNSRLNLSGSNMSVHVSSSDDLNKGKPPQDPNAGNLPRKRAISVPRAHPIIETHAVAVQENSHLEKGRLIPKYKNHDTVEETFDNLLMDGIQTKSDNEEVRTEESKQNEVHAPVQNSPFHSLQHIPSVNDPEIDSIKTKILSRISSIEARRRSSSEGIRQFSLDLSSKDFSGQEFSQREGISEKSNEETTPRKRVNCVESNRGEENLQDNEETANLNHKIKALEQSEHKSYGSMNAISRSPAPKINLTAYNTYNERLVTLGASELEAVLSGNTNQDARFTLEDESSEGQLRTNEQETRIKINQDRFEKEARRIADFAIAEYDYLAQKENDLTFKQGDTIQILKKTETGWWIGLCNNRIGYFPSNFVSLVHEDN